MKQIGDKVKKRTIDTAFIVMPGINGFKTGLGRKLTMLGALIYSMLYFYYSLGNDNILPYGWRV